MQKKYPKEKIKTTALVGEPVVVQLKALNSLRSNSRAFLTLLFSFLSPSSLRSIIRFCETMLSQREAVFYSRLKNAPLCSFSFRPLGLNLSVENASTYRFPVGAKNLSPSYPFRPSFLSCQRHESSGRKRILPNKNINLGEVAHLPPRIVATGGKAAPCRIFMCGYAFLQIVARLRHAVICHDRRFRLHFFQAVRSEPIGRK